MDKDMAEPRQNAIVSPWVGICLPSNPAKSYASCRPKTAPAFSAFTPSMAVRNCSCVSDPQEMWEVSAGAGSTSGPAYRPSMAIEKRPHQAAVPTTSCPIARAGLELTAERGDALGQFFDIGLGRNAELCEHGGDALLHGGAD